MTRGPSDSATSSRKITSILRCWLSVYCLPLLTFAGIAVLQARALDRVPLAAYGTHGAEYIPHLQRAYATRLLEQEGWAIFHNPWQALRGLDGHYPALLHLLTAAWNRLLGARGEAVFVTSVHLNLLWLALLAWAVAHLLRHAPYSIAKEDEAGSSTCAGSTREGPEGPIRSMCYARALSDASRQRAAALAATFALLSPGIFGPARRYYYDLPMTACIMAAAAFLVGGKGLNSPARATGAALASSAALLFKWAAGLYLFPVWLVAFGQTLVAGRADHQASASKSLTASRGRAWLNGGMALVLVATMVWRVASRPGGSFSFELGLAASSALPGLNLSENIMFYLGSLHTAGIGRLLTLFLVPSLALAFLSRAGRHILLLTAFPILLPLAYLVLRLTVLDGRYLMPLLPWFAVVAGVACFAYKGVEEKRLSSHCLRHFQLVILLFLALWQVARIDGLFPFPTSGNVRANKPKLDRLEPWRSWWWTGAAQDRLSEGLAYAPAARAALALAPSGRIWVSELPGEPLPIHAWHYYINTESSRPGSLVAQPVTASAHDFVGKLIENADVIVGRGTTARPEHPGRWLEAATGLSGFGEALCAQLLEAFPVHKRVEARGEEVNISAKEHDR